MTQDKIDFKSDLLSGQKRAYNEPRQPYGLFHNSDMIGCLRQQGYQHVKGWREFTDTTLMYFLFGEIMDTNIKTLASWVNDGKNETVENFKKYLGPEYAVKELQIWNGIAFRPDALHRKTNVVVEVKTARSYKVRYGPRQHQVDQLKNYMAVFNAPYGIMFYIIATEFEDPFVQHYVYWDDENEKRRLQDKLLSDKQLLQTAIEKGDPSILPQNGATERKFKKELYDKSTRKWYPIKKSFLCENCQYLQECNPPRQFEPECNERLE